MLRTLRRITSTSLGLLALVAAGCNSGSETGEARVRCSDASSFCVTACNLGCSLGGCTVSEIAENQRITLVFSQPVDPETATFGNFGLTTASGEAARGQFVVNGATVEFIPDVSVVGGVTEFGFRRNETYILNLRTGADRGIGVRSVSGDALGTRLNCSLQVTRGIIDFDQSAPKARLISPTATEDVSVTTPIVIEFSEIIDVSPFQGASTATTPVLYQLKPSFITTGGERQCDRSFPPQLVEGVPSASLDLVNNTTTITLQPAINLPAGACVEISVTGNVRDLSGRAAEAASFSFLTLPSSGQERTISERFNTGAQRDPNLSSGVWANGRATPGLLGGDGIHGSFDPSIGLNLGNQIFEWDTSNTMFPARVTPNNQPITVADGKYYFEDFILPAATTLRFVGPHPVEIRVMGKVEIAGKIECNGKRMTVFGAKNTLSGALLPGQPGGVPGPGGGAGGRGANRNDGSGNASGVNGANGQPVQLKTGHAYATQAAATGGRGSTVWPASGRSQDVQYTVSFVFSGQIQSGGGGGGFDIAGVDGTVQQRANGATLAQQGPDTNGGALFDPFPIPGGTSSIDHFLIGGSGGGGGGSHVFLALTNQALDTWRAGGGGSGGGGAIAIRSGGDLVVGGSGVIECRGGDGVTFSDANLVAAGIATINKAYPAPGGGGSGGSVLLQSQSSIIQSGLLDTSGGTPSNVDGVTPVQVAARTTGGAGSPGFVRLEVPSGLINAGNTVPTATGSNVGQLVDRDDFVGDISKWYGTQLVFPPTYQRYEMEVDFGNGIIQTYSDDPAVGPLANNPQDAVRLHVQGARVSALTGEADETSIGAWREFAGNLSGTPSLNNDSATGFRFRLTFNRRDFPNATVRRVSIVFRD